MAAPPAVEGSNVALLAVPVLLRPPRARPPVLLVFVVVDVPLLMVDAVLLRFASLDRYAISSVAAPDADEAPEPVADPGGGGLSVMETNATSTCI